jgi:hypothetical protein
MPLPIRDGNQSLTTLSTILVSNSHIPAHTVISFGTQGITDIATAVSGVELGPNTLNALENITVTLGQVTITGGLTDTELRASAVTIGGVVTATISGTPSVTFGTAVITGSTSILNFPATQPVSIASVTIGNSITIGSLPNISGTVTVSNLPATQAVTFGQSTITGSVSVLNLPATQTVTFTQAPVTFGTAVVTGSTSILNFPSTQTVTFGTSAVTGSVSVLNFPASQAVTFTNASVTFGTAVITGSTSIIGTATITGSTSILNFPASQSVTFSQASVTFGTAVITGSTSIIGTPSVTFTQIATHGVTIGAGTAQIGSVTASISGTPSITFGTAVITGSTSILNFPATQTVTFTQASVTFGTAVVTGSTSIIGTASVTFTQIATHGVTIGEGTAQIGSVTASISGTPSVTFGTSVVTGSVSVLNIPATQAVTFGATTGSVSVLNFPASQSVTFSAVSISNFPATQPVSLATLPALVAGTAKIGSVTASISGTVTASIIDPDNTLEAVLQNSLSTIISGFVANVGDSPASKAVQIGFYDPTDDSLLLVNNTNQKLPISGTVTIGSALPAGTNQIGSVTASISGTVPISISSVTVGNSVTIGSLPAISGTVTANLSISSTALTSGSFTSLTSGTLVPANTARRMATVYNLGAGQLFINAGVTATTLGGGFMVALSAGDFYECNYTTTTLSAIFATAGTASWISH